MVFSSLLFIYIFLPLNLICYAAFSDIRKKNICVLMFSLVFYGWTSPRFLLLLMAMALINYIGARVIEKYRHVGRLGTVALIADLILSLGILGYFKYLGFFCQVVQSFTGAFSVIPSIVLPAGISFYTFQLISYVVDVYRGEVEADKKYTNVLMYTALFYQCLAGPIVRYRDIADDIRERKTNISAMSEGISRFCVGLAKKTLLANSCSSILTTMLPENVNRISQTTVLASWVGGLIYMLEIYLDFSAYSDMAIGLGKMTGFHYKENFRYPYVAQSITDFWRRWHISLSTFFRDYVYIPLGGNKKGLKRQLVNMFIVWALTGLWHGAAYNFICWGLYFFVFLAAEKLFLLKLFRKLPTMFSTILPRVYTFLVVYFGWILFRFSDINMAKQMLRSMFGMNGNVFTNLETNTLILNNIILLIVCIVVSTPVVSMSFGRLKMKAEENSIANTYIYNGLNVVIPMVLLFLSTIALIGNSYNPFIYFRF